MKRIRILENDSHILEELRLVDKPNNIDIRMKYIVYVKARGFLQEVASSQYLTKRIKSYFNMI